jgi:hypothetical protein
MDDTLKSEGKIKLGTCKTRRNDLVPVFSTKIDGPSGYISDSSANVEQKTLNDVIEDLGV